MMRFLRYLYNPAESLPEDPGYFRGILGDIELFSIHAQVYQLLKTTQRLGDVPDFFRRELALKSDRVLAQNMYLKTQEACILRAFEQCGVPVIPIKGVRFAVRYFGHLGARGSSDIDLLVPHAQLSEAFACVRSLGFAGPALDPLHFHGVFVQHGDWPLSVELHWDLVQGNSSHLDISALWDKAEPVPGYAFVKQLSSLDTLYTICLHGANHRMDALKYLIDVAQIVVALGIELDYARLFAKAWRDGTFLRVLTVLAIVYRQFPSLNAVKPLINPFFSSTPSIQLKLARLWNYDVLKHVRAQKGRLPDRAYYSVYYVLFSVLTVDTWRQRMRAIVDRVWLVPSRLPLYVRDLIQTYRDDEQFELARNGRRLSPGKYGL